MNFFRKPPNNTLWKIPKENSVGDSLCNWHDEQCSQFTDGITEGIYRRKIPSVIPLAKMTRHLFFLLCFKFFSHGNSVGIYRGNISVGKIPRKFTDENISSVFPFVFINFLVVGGICGGKQVQPFFHSKRLVVAQLMKWRMWCDSRRFREGECFSLSFFFSLFLQDSRYSNQ